MSEGTFPMKIILYFQKGKDLEQPVQMLHLLDRQLLKMLVSSVPHLLDKLLLKMLLRSVPHLLDKQLLMLVSSVPHLQNRQL